MDAFGGALLRKLESDPQDAKPYVDELVASLGLTLSERDYDMATRLMIRAQYDLLRALISRHTKQWRPWIDDDPAGALLARLSDEEAPPTPAPTKVQAKFGLLSEVAREAIPDLARQEGFAPKRIADYENAVETFTLALGRDPDLSEVTADIAGRFMRDLTRYPTNVRKRKPYCELETFSARLEAAKAANEPDVLGPVTINTKYLTPLRRIFAWRRAECSDLANPFDRVSAPKPRRTDARKQRRIFSDSEVARLLALPVFTGSKGVAGPSLHQPGAVKVSDWRFWVPLICLFSGMRLNEACGLAVADVRHDHDVPHFHVRDEVPGQRLKSDAARRKVPIHDALLEIGILDFVEGQRRAGRVRLFEELEGDASGYFSGKASKFFHHLIAKIADDDPDHPGKLVFHSTRHTVITHLRAAEVREDVSKELVGHEQGETHGKYGVSPLDTLARAVNKVVYAGVDLGAISR